MGKRRHPAAASKKKPPPPLSPAEVSSLISLTAAAASRSSRFLASHDLTLLPAQTLALDSLLSSLSRLLPAPAPSPPPSSPSWFHRFLASTPSPSDPRWTDSFRISGPSFYLLLPTLAPALHSPHLPIPADHKLAAALFRLAHAAPFRAVAHRFALPSPHHACRAFYETVRAVSSQLAHLFELPTDLPRVLQGFHWSSLPNCSGILSFSRFSSVTAQALIDSEGRFLNISVGWDGRTHPADILTNSKLYTEYATDLSSGPPVELSTGSINRYVLGDICCPLLPWILTPYPPGSGSVKAEKFNAAHKRGMQIGEQAFGRVRARWQLLRMRWTEECVEALPHVVVAGCLLHNYLIKCSEVMPDAVEVDGAVTGFPGFDGEVDEGGVRARDVLASHLSSVIEEHRLRDFQNRSL